MSMSICHPFIESVMDLKVELSQFDINGDYSIWKQKIRAIFFVSMRVTKALDDLVTFSDELNSKLNEIEGMSGISYKSIILHLYNNIARQVDGAKTARTLYRLLLILCF